MKNGKKLTRAMKTALSHIAAGRSPATGMTTQSEHGGLDGTLGALHRRGLLDRNGITEAGRQLVASWPSDDYPPR